MFVCHIQPVEPDLPCSVIHVAPAVNGKGTERTVHQLARLMGIRRTQFNFTVAGVAFDGDSCFNTLHDGVESSWRGLMASDMPSISRQHPPQPLVRCDPLHLLKRIRYRWVIKQFSVANASRGFSFSLTRIRQAGYLSPVVFTNTQESTMHDSLPLKLFSVKTLAFVLVTDLPGEVVVVPWC
jgi:hypothetical protein